jgi:hypothetical protein
MKAEASFSTPYFTAAGFSEGWPQGGDRVRLCFEISALVEKPR